MRYHILNRERGSTEAIGAVLLVAVAVVSLAVVGGMISSDKAPEKLPAVQAVISTTSDGKIFIYHDGGDTLRKNEMQFLVNNVKRDFKKYDGSEFGSDWSTFSMGETLVYQVDSSEQISSVDVIFGTGSLSSTLTSAQFLPDKETGAPAAPVAGFSAIPTNGTAPLAVQFRDTSTNVPVSWKWSFGDGTNSTERNPSHIYATPGTYTVSLTATNIYGSNTATKTGYITVTSGPVAIKPVVNFTGTPLTGPAPLTVQFTDYSNNTPTSWQWIFGDGTSSSLQNPSHVYANAGTYTVTLTAANAGGNGTMTRTDYISVKNYVKKWRATYYNTETWTVPVLTNYPPRLNFADDWGVSIHPGISSDVANWPEPYLGRTEYFSAEYDGLLYVSTPALYTFYLNSDDGSYLKIDSTQVIDHGGLHNMSMKTGQIYLEAGYHPIDVKMFNHQEVAVLSLQYSSSTMARQDVTDVWQVVSTSVPVANFTATPLSGAAPLVVQFTDTSANSPTSWAWDINNDGTTDYITQNPTHTFTSAGTYSVKLTATNAAGSSTVTKTGYISVNQTSLARYIVDKNVFIYGKKLDFEGDYAYGPGSTIIITGPIGTSDLNGGTSIAASNIYVNGQVLDGGSASLGSPVTPGAIYVKGDTSLWSGGRYIYGDVYVDGDLALKDAKIYGNVYVNGDLTLGWTPYLSDNTHIYYTGTLSAPSYYNSAILAKCVHQDSVPGFVMPDLSLGSLKTAEWYAAKGYVTSGELTSNMKIIADNGYYSDARYYIPSAYNVVIIARNGDIELEDYWNKPVSGILYAPNGKVTFEGSSFTGVIISRDGFYETSGGTWVNYMNLATFIPNPDDYPF